MLGWFCAPTLLALCLPGHLRKDPWERVAESHLPQACVRVGAQGHPPLLPESGSLSPMLGAVPLHVCPPPHSRRDKRVVRQLPRMRSLTFQRVPLPSLPALSLEGQAASQEVSRLIPDREEISCRAQERESICCPEHTGQGGGI